MKNPNNGSGRNRNRNSGRNADGGVGSNFMFLQGSKEKPGAPVPGTDGKTYDDIVCYNCNNLGHYADHCPLPPKNKRNDVSLLQSSQHDEGEGGMDDGDQVELMFVQIGEVVDTSKEQWEGRRLPKTLVQPLPRAFRMALDGIKRCPVRTADTAKKCDGGMVFQADGDDTRVVEEGAENGVCDYGLIFSQVGVMFGQASRQHIPAHWILLDSQSTACVFNNKRFLSSIRRSSKTLMLKTNGGYHRSNMNGDLGNFGMVWYYESSLANILSLTMVQKVCRMTMGTAKEAAIVVHQSDGSEMKFLEYESGLYYYDTLSKSNSSKATVSSYCMIQTVAKNKSLFTRREVEGADQAQEL